MFNPINVSNEIKDEYIGYISTLFSISDREYLNDFKRELKKAGTVAKGPYLDITDSFKTGKSIRQLMQEGKASKLFEKLEGNIPDEEKELQINRPLYLHQEQALCKANEGNNLIVTTGTGSGKTECFMIPIINYLLKEKEEGSLDSGVRAILIYPMNALANDQMKRMRNLLKSFPDITFGVYNSSTKHNNQDGIEEYGKIYKDGNGAPLKPLPNELVSREQMQQTPPNILVTNYAMLEYMMLRPLDDKVFSGAKLRFLILDEAHVYHGTTGMETSLLLKRLKARISDPVNVLHILTSATLGGKESNQDIVRFASTLCSAAFKEENIIRSETIAPIYPSSGEDIPLKLFEELANPEQPINDIVESYGISISEGQKEEEFLYELCIRSSIYRKIREVVSHPMTISEIKDCLLGDLDVTKQDIINIINVASKASIKKVPLIKARYHMFVRALEGAYITVGKNKSLTLSRNTQAFIAGETYKIFESAICDDCGRMGIVGKKQDGKLEFANNIFDQDREYYLLREKIESSSDFDEDEDTGNTDIEKNDYRLCSKCGYVVHESAINDLPCGCGIDSYVKVRKVIIKDGRTEGKCPSCNMGTLKSVYLGYDAATSVIGTSLFEKLPESEKVLKIQPRENESKKRLFGRKKKSSTVDIIKKKRQFLSFSDSRGEAAYFASSMTSSYAEFLRRRAIWQVVTKNKEDMSRHPWEIIDFVNELTALFDSNRTFASPGDKGSTNLSAISRKNAWIAVLNEMVNQRRATSLVSLGILKFDYIGNNEEGIEDFAEAYGKNVKDVKAVFDLMVRDIVVHGALEGDVELTDDEKEYIFYSTRPKRVTLCKDSAKDEKKPYLLSWSAGRRKNGNFISNNRLKRIMRFLQCDEEEANEILQDYWQEVLLEGDGLHAAGNGEYYFRTDRFKVTATTEDIPIYKCTLCGKITMYNSENYCNTIKCKGRLEKITHREIIENNHYASRYLADTMEPLHIKEHTAQLGREEQQKYQEMFVNKDINALSCSTTFEMGVDVGDLETVYLRNIPPSPANYIQRAGRAGRGKNAAAYALTFAKLSSHDFSYYNNPQNMIMGKIKVPLFTVKNEKVILRHIFAVALSDFFSKQVDVYNQNNADVLLNGDGWERLCDYLQSKPERLKVMIQNSIPEDMHDIMGVNDYSWIEKLIGEEGVMYAAVMDFRETIQYYMDEMDRFKADGALQEAAAIEKKLWLYRRGKDDNKGKNDLIEFLVRNNILPKYGFPVDTVELYQNTNTLTDKKLQMVRDLQLAISEYAPDAQVVADGKLYTSRYIRKLPQATGQGWETVYIAQCPNPYCKTWNYRAIMPDHEGEECISCKDTISKGYWKSAIEPRKGFIADSKPQEVGMKKPEKTYRSEDYYIGNPQKQSMYKYSFSTKDGYAVQMETSINDSLMVVCNDDFYVCPGCGYAESQKENQDNAEFNTYKRTLEKKHKTPWGKKCELTLQKNKLCHVFKTDAVHLTFASGLAKRQDVMLSVMYALLEAISAELDIERNDIKGCLHKVKFQNSLIYTIVLYDAVAGGAGHVRRIVTEDGSAFIAIVKKAIEITKNCNCSPSCYNCLRNYYNQKIHSILNRQSVYTFLADYMDEYSLISQREFEEKSIAYEEVFNENSTEILNEEQNIMLPNPRAYNGNERYIFISYAHRDNEQVMDIIRCLQKKGYRIWFDEGINPGNEWDDDIADHILGSEYVIGLISSSSLASQHCKDELKYAHTKHKKVYLVYLEDVELMGGMEMRFSRMQAIRKFALEDERFYNQFGLFPGIEKTKE